MRQTRTKAGTLRGSKCSTRRWQIRTNKFRKKWNKWETGAAGAVAGPQAEIFQWIVACFARSHAALCPQPHWVIEVDIPTAMHTHLNPKSNPENGCMMRELWTIEPERGFRILLFLKLGFHNVFLWRTKSIIKAESAWALNCLLTCLVHALLMSSFPTAFGWNTSLQTWTEQVSLTAFDCRMWQGWEADRHLWPPFRRPLLPEFSWPKASMFTK